MKKLICKSLFISILILVSCNNSSEADKTKDSLSKTDTEEVKDNSDTKKDLTPIEQGQNYAMQTQKVLAENLMKEISTNGTVPAFTFCSEKAYPLTDSMARALNVKLKRVSDKARNPNNMANQPESAYISESKELLAKGENIKPKMTETNGKMLGYYPIMTNGICMQCHGIQNTEVLPETLLEIKKLYPNDKGIDYKINELRGIWVVEMDVR